MFFTGYLSSTGSYIPYLCPCLEVPYGSSNAYLRDLCYLTMGGDLAPNLGGTKIIFRGPISGKISIFRVKISDDLLFSHRLGSSDFPFLFSHFPYVYYVKCRI